ncbi:hypothetical protein [Nonomuraea sp. NPDC050643]|uniref:hypothetical protein n=1 Tax=Nonomuraea sp. NPDC050643 TaxID=3155660 RepID=UPI0033EDE1B2
MEGDHRVWPPRPGPRHRRTPPDDTGPDGTDPDGTDPDAHRDEESRRGRRERADPVRPPHPLDLEPDLPDISGRPQDRGASGPPWNGHLSGGPRDRETPGASGGRRDGDASPGPRNRDTSGGPRSQGAAGGWRGRDPYASGGSRNRDTSDGSQDRDASGGSRDRGISGGSRNQDASGRSWDRDASGGRTGPGPEDSGRWRDLDPDGFDWGRRAHPLDLDPDEPSWNPRIRGTSSGAGAAPADGDAWDALPPSAHLHRSPANPGLPRRAGGRAWRRWAEALVALAAGAALVSGAAMVALRFTAPPAPAGRLSDSLAGVTATLPQGWIEGAVAPVTGFTSVVRNEDGGLVMARPVPGPVADAKKATAQAAELYSRLLLKGDRVSVVDDRPFAGGYTRALRAEYQDVVNRPAYLRVMLLTRQSTAVLLVGLLQPEENSSRQALDAVMTSIR